MYSKISHGSEGVEFNKNPAIWLMYSKISHGSEGCLHISFIYFMLYTSTLLYGSEGFYYIFLVFFCKRQFKTNVQGFIFMNLYWPIGNCLYQLAFSFIEIIYVLQCPLELGSQGLLFSYYICRFCVCFFMKCPSFRTKI